MKLVNITNLHPAERDAILAGLRLLQRKLEQGGFIPAEIEAIYTNSFSQKGISARDIDILCERVNTSVEVTT